MDKQSPAAKQPTFTLTDGYRRYALTLMVMIYVVNFIDRQIFSILIEPIKAEIELSDTQLGFLGGIAFAIFYTFAGIPIARWADRGSRTTIVTLALVIWSAFTAVTGFARNFCMLLVARVGVGIGEAGCSPPIHSLISDYFPPERRGTALSTYALGIPIGGAVGTLAGGWIGEYFGWRMAFFVVGVPGLILAVITRFTLREPPRGFSDGADAPPPAPSSDTSIADVLRFLWRLRSFRHLSMAAALHGFVGYGVGLFLPSFFIRIHGFGLAETSTYLFLIGLTGMIGTFSGGWLSDRFGHSDKRWYMWIPGIATCGALPFGVLFYTTDHPMLALVLAVPGAILGPMYLGPSFAMTQSLVNPGMRAMASALLLFILNIIGLGLGPWFVGYLSDLLRPEFGVAGLRYALFSVAMVGGAWATLHYVLAARTLNEDLQEKEQLQAVS